MATSDLYGFKYLSDYGWFPEWHTGKEVPNIGDPVFVIARSASGHICKCWAKRVRKLFGSKWVFNWSNDRFKPVEVIKWSY